MRLASLGGGAATTGLVLGAVVALAPAQNAPPEAAHTDSSIRKFDHAQHAALETPVAIAECETCHGKDPSGKLAQPAQSGHQPCLRSGCHAEDFLSVGARTRRDSPERYARAAGFCQGCHASAKGQAPAPFQKAAADNTYRHNPAPGHYVEFNHLVHSERTACRTCHVVDPETFALDLESPGHRECATCHKDNSEQGMAKCEGCHHEGAPSSYFKERKFSSDVRSCVAERSKTPEVGAKRRAPCFAHERKGHRFRAGGEPVQCGDCHFMFRAKSYEGHRYDTLLGIKQAPLMDNSRDRAHKKCGAAGCHTREVDDSQGAARCGLCHSKKSIMDGLLENGSVEPSPELDRFDEPADAKGTKSDDFGDLVDKPTSGKGKKRRRDTLKGLVD